MKSSLTKSALARQTETIVATMGSLETLLRNIPEPLKMSDLSFNDIRFVFTPEGKGELIEEGRDTPGRSAHTTLLFETFKIDLNAHVQTLADQLNVLISGQTLVLAITFCGDMFQTRFKLYLGRAEITGTTNPVIDTVLSRWKAPLARLAVYLDTKKDTTPDTVYLFHENLDISQNSGLIGKSNTILVPAHSLEDAWKVHSFHHAPQAATLRPTVKKFDMISQSVTPVSQMIAFTKATWETRFKDIASNHPNCPYALPKTVDEATNNLNASLLKLDSEINSEIVFDLKKDVVTFSYTDHPLSGSENRQTSQMQRLDVEEKAKTLSTLLRDILQTLYPNMQDGKMVLTCANTQSATFNKVNQWRWNVNLDGYRFSVGYFQLQHLFHNAMMLQTLDISETQHTYVLHSKPKNLETNTNVAVSAQIIRACNPEHAMACFLSPLNGNVYTSGEWVLYKVIPFNAVDRDSVASLTESAANKAYNKS